MKTANIVIWLHGVQSEVFDPQPIYACQAKVSEMVKRKDGDAWEHSLFNWDAEVTVRERVLFSLVKGRGNMLTKAIRQAIVFTGCDMWWTLSTLKNGQPGWVCYEIMQKLEAIIGDKLSYWKARGYRAQFHLVCHSWGTWVGMQQIIAHQEMNFNFITFGCPLFYGSGAYDDWGDPDKVPNLKYWTNIAIENDPIATVASDNPNPKWAEFVKDHVLSRFQPLPIKSHTMYWSDSETQNIIATALQNYPTEIK